MGIDMKSIESSNCHSWSCMSHGHGHEICGVFCSWFMVLLVMITMMFHGHGYEICGVFQSLFMVLLILTMMVSHGHGHEIHGQPIIVYVAAVSWTCYVHHAYWGNPSKCIPKFMQCFGSIVPCRTVVVLLHVGGGQQSFIFGSSTLGYGSHKDILMMVTHQTLLVK